MVEWAVIVYDKPGADRSGCRPQHIAAIPAAVEAGKVTNAGAIFNTIPEAGKPLDFAGSFLNIVADSREGVMDILKEDIFAKEGIWDLNNVLIYPFGCAVKVGKEFGK